VPRPSTSIIARPVKRGDEWYVLAKHRSGQQEHVRRFKTEGKPRIGLPESRKLGSKNGATPMISRVEAAPDYFLRRRAFSTSLRLGPARFRARLTSPLPLPVFSLRIGLRNPGPQPLDSGHLTSTPPRLCYFLADQSSSASRFTAGAFGFLLLSQCRERPKLYGDCSRAMPMITGTGSLRQDFCK
jgi:hypothetical protein